MVTFISGKRRTFCDLQSMLILFGRKENNLSNTYIVEPTATKLPPKCILGRVGIRTKQ